MRERARFKRVTSGRRARGRPGRGRERFPSSEELDDVVERLAGEAERRGIEAAVIDGYAMQWYGSPRLTRDVDFAALAPLPGFGGRRLKIGGFRRPVEHGIMADWILRKDEVRGLYEDAIRNAVDTGEGFRVATSEHLLAMKIVAGRPKDKLDAMYLLRHRLVDVERAVDLISRFASRRVLAQVLLQLAHAAQEPEADEGEDDLEK